jgi:hypothetical protein
MTTSRRSFLFGTGTLALGCAHGGWMPGWRTLQTKHFVAHAAVPRDAEALLVILEHYYAALQTFFAGAELPLIEVLTLAPSDFTHSFGNNRAGMALTASPGATPIGKTGLLVMTTNRQSSSDGALLAHLFIAHRFPKAPLWLQEGLAEYLGRSSPNRDRACFGHIFFASQPTIPLAQMLETSWEALDRDDARLWYQFTAHVLVHMIIHDPSGPLGARMAPLFQAAADGKSGREVLQAAFGQVPLEDLQKMFDAKMVAVRAKTDHLTCPFVMPIPARFRAEKVDPGSREVSKEAIGVLMQDLERLPLRRSGFQRWYPPEVVATLK